MKNTGNTKMKKSIFKKLAASMAVAVMTMAMVAVPALAQAPPAAPTGLVVVAVNAGQANLFWTDNSTDETQFRIERAIDEEFDTAIEFLVEADVTTYTDFTILGASTYFYRVFAVNLNGSSPPSNEVRIFTPTSMPTAAVVTPAGSPAEFQSGLLNDISVSATGVGAAIAEVEYQLLLNDAPGTFIAQDIASEPDQTPFSVPATLSLTPTPDTTPVPEAELPIGAVLEFQIYGRVAQAGDAGNGFEWIIGTGEPSFTIYESANTMHARARHPVVGDAVWISALRTVASGPLVAERVTFRGPDPQPVAPASYKLAALYKGSIQSMDDAYMALGVSYGGETWTIGGVPFRVDAETDPAFPAYLDEGLIVGNPVEVRFWVSNPAVSMPIARSIFPQVQTLELPPVNPNPSVINDTPLAMGLPPGTRVQFNVVGIITAQDLNTLTWTLGIGEESFTVYGHALTIPLSDAFRVVPNIGDEVVVMCRRTLTPGPLVADGIFILADGPAPAFELGETRAQINYLFNGSVSDMGAANGGTTWSVSISGVPQQFIMNDPYDTAIVDRGPLPAIGLGTPVTVDFLPPTQVLPEDNWAELEFNAGTSLWETSIALPGVAADQTGYLFVRTFDAANQGSSIVLPAMLLAQGANVAPVAVDDSYTATGTTPLIVAAPGVLGNDTDADGPSPLTATNVVGPAIGTLLFNPDGSFTYTYPSNPATPQIVTFTYQAFDGDLLSNIATVTITVNNNASPVAVNDSYNASGTTPLVVAAPGVLGNDTDTELNPLTAVLNVGPAISTLVFNADGSFTYTYPVNPASPVIQTFTYHANDGTSDSNIATVQITINPAVAGNQPPVAVNDNLTAKSKGKATLNVLANDFDPDGTIDKGSIVIVTPPPPGQGTVTVSNNGTVRYSANGFVGVTSFTYTVMDNQGQVSNIATVVVTVSASGQANVGVIRATVA